jgi:hypothetical protein
MPEEVEMKRFVFLVLILILTACAPAVLPATPTATGTATLVPTLTLTPTSTATMTPTPVPNGPCDNPLIPLAVGNQWTYRVTTDGMEKIYHLRAVEQKDIGNIVTVVEFGDEQQSVQEKVVCLNGVIEDFPLFVMDMLFADRLNKFMNTYHDQGLYAPSYALLADTGWALDWQAFYLTEDIATIQNPLGGDNLSIVQSSEMDLTFHTDGTREAVTVPAGEYPQALKVLHSFTMTATWGSNGGHLIIDTTQWYEPYVGLVRAQVDTASFSMGIQKAGIPWNSVLELVGFTLGK